MGSAFTPEEKKVFLLKKHLKENRFEYISAIVLDVVIIIIVLHLCEAKYFFPGLLATLAYSLVKTVYKIRAYIDKLNWEVKDE